MTSNRARVAELKTKLLPIENLKPAEYNPRKKLTPEDSEYKKIQASIERWGYCDPVIVNKDMTVIGGHQRLKVMKDLGYTQISAVVLDIGKNDEKALNVALNKISGSWDFELLSNLMSDLVTDGFDVELTGFDAVEIVDLIGDDEDKGENHKQDEDKENERMRTIRTYNLDLYDEEDCDGFYQMPVIYNNKVIPQDLIGFNYALSSSEKNIGIHCFVDDYQFERVWNNPDNYIDALLDYQVVLSPDFSLYLDMPMAMKVWNVYRSRLIGQYWQRNGIRVIPTISWAEPATFSFCFDGIPEGSIVAVSTIGVKRSDESLKIWIQGMDEMIRRIKPTVILVYGGKLEYSYPDDCKVIYFDNQVTERMKESR